MVDKLSDSTKETIQGMSEKSTQLEKVRCARNLGKLSAVSLCILTFSGSVSRAGKLLLKKRQRPCIHPSMHKINLKSYKEIAFEPRKWEKIQALKIPRWLTRAANFLKL